MAGAFTAWFTSCFQQAGSPPQGPQPRHRAPELLGRTLHRQPALVKRQPDPGLVEATGPLRADAVTGDVHRAAAAVHHHEPAAGLRVDVQPPLRAAGSQEVPGVYRAVDGGRPWFLDQQQAFAVTGQPGGHRGLPHQAPLGVSPDRGNGHAPPDVVGGVGELGVDLQDLVQRRLADVPKGGRDQLHHRGAVGAAQAALEPGNSGIRSSGLQRHSESAGEAVVLGIPRASSLSQRCVPCFRTPLAGVPRRPAQQ
jgi:hypothetical protein